MLGYDDGGWDGILFVICITPPALSLHTPLSSRHLSFFSKLERVIGLRSCELWSLKDFLRVKLKEIVLTMGEEPRAAP